MAEEHLPPCWPCPCPSTPSSRIPKNPAAWKTLDALTAMDITTLRTIDGDVHLFTDGQKRDGPLTPYNYL